MQTVPPLAPIPDIEDVSELLHHLQFGEKCKSKSSSSSRSSSSDASINPLAFKAHIPTSERRAASATKTHFYRRYKSTADELCHLIDPVAGEREDLSPSERAFGLEQIENDPELTTERERRKARERVLTRFEHKILALRRLGVVNDKFHINHASNLFMPTALPPHLILPPVLAQVPPRPRPSHFARDALVNAFDHDIFTKFQGFALLRGRRRVHPQAPPGDQRAEAEAERPWRGRGASESLRAGNDTAHEAAAEGVALRRPHPPSRRGGGSRPVSTRYPAVVHPAPRRWTRTTPLAGPPLRLRRGRHPAQPDPRRPLRPQFEPAMPRPPAHFQSTPRRHQCGTQARVLQLGHPLPSHPPEALAAPRGPQRQDHRRAPRPGRSPLHPAHPRN